MLPIEQDEKMQLFMNTDLWQETILRATIKQIDYNLLSMFAMSQYRVSLAYAMETGAFFFSPPTLRTIPKDDGKGTREILVSTELERVVFAQITRVFQQMYKNRINPNCLAYRKGWSTAKAIRFFLSRIEGAHVGYKTDYSKFFDTVPIDRINQILEQLNTGSVMDKLLYDFYNTNIVKVNGQYVNRYKSLCQGSAFSSFLANVCLKEMDDEASKLCKSYTRYSDDIMMMGDGADEALAYVKEYSANLGLTLNKKKIQTIQLGDTFTFLGGKITGNEIDLGYKSVMRLKSKVRDIISKTVRKGDRNSQKKAIYQIKQSILSMTGDVSRSWFSHAAGLVNTNKGLKQLDFWIKDRLKAAYAGCNNVTTYNHKTSNEMLEELGWVSLNHLYQLYRISPDLYQAEVLRVKWERAHVIS